MSSSTHAGGSARRPESRGGIGQGAVKVEEDRLKTRRMQRHQVIDGRIPVEGVAAESGFVAHADELRFQARL